MNEELLKLLQEKIGETIDKTMETSIKGIVGEEVANATKGIVEKMRADFAATGKDISGLSEEKKLAFADVIKSIARGETINKANEALIEETDSRGGYLVATEVAAAILRIAASVGIVLNQAQKWPMNSNDLLVPAYSGAVLEGEYLDVDTEGSLTPLSFGQVKLLVKKWQTVFVMGNDLLADANVDVANWCLALIGESLANMVDKQGFIGAGAPFTGILNNTDVSVYTLPTGATTFDKFNVVEDANNMIAAVEESVLPGAGFYMEKSVWSKLKSQKDASGRYILTEQGAVSAGVLASVAAAGGPKPAGEMASYPVYTCRHLPKQINSAIDTKFLVFGNLKNLAYGDKGEVRIEQYTSGNFSGEIARKDQKAVVAKHRHALAVGLPASFVVAKTAHA